MKRFWMPVLIIVTLILAGCSTPIQPEEVHAAVEPSSSPAPSVLSQSSEDDNSSEELDPTAAVPLPGEAPKPEIVHTMFPGEFVITPLQRIFDCTTGQRAAGPGNLTLSTSCDQWEINYFERPVNQDIGDYSPQLDIAKGEFGQDENWYYARLFIFSEGYQDVVLDGVYAIELDLNLDARGDVLLLAQAPANNPAGEWSVTGVQVWQDANDDVGGLEAMSADPNTQGDGYEKLVFEDGQGEDPDLAWIRISLDEPGLVEFAFKTDLLGSGESFEWWMWAMKENLGAGKFDPVDFYLADSVYYLDNTCGWIYGASLRDLPNLCNTISAPPTTPTEYKGCQPPSGGCLGVEWLGEPDCKCNWN